MSKSKLFELELGKSGALSPKQATKLMLKRIRRSVEVFMGDFI
jgi:hypothetical protein